MVAKQIFSWKQGYFFACGLALVVATSVPLMAQMTNTGRISGTVTDTSKAIIVDATVTVTDEATGAMRKVTTDDHGYYVVTNLPVGSYTVSAAQPGFGPVKKAGNRLYGDGRVTLDFVLSPGKVTETVEVTANAETVNTTSGEVSRLIDMNQVQDLALNGRNYMQLVSLIPGAALLNDDAMGQTTSLSATADSINGARSNQNLLTVDGGFDLDSGSNGSQINNVGVDFIQEMSIKTSNFSAEYGRNAGSAIDVVTRHGGNQFHGAAFEYVRNDKFDAANFFSPLDSQGNPIKQKLRFNDFGWDLGGPIRKNKLFFFAGQEWKRIRQNAAPVRRTLPTTLELQGNFSETATTPLTLPPNAPAGCTITNNVMSPQCISPDGQAIINLYTAMEQQAASFSEVAAGNNAVYQASEPFNWREDIIRGDYTINSRQSVYLRYIHDNYNIFLPFGFSCSSDLPACPQNRLRPGTSYQLSHTWLISPTLVNEATLSAAWNGQRIPPVGTSWERSTYGFVFPQLFPNGGGRFRNSIPSIHFSGQCGTIPNPTNPSKTINRGCPSRIGSESHSLLSPTTDITTNETLTWNHGQHTVKFGFVVIRNRKDQNSRSSYAGDITFSNSSSNPNTTGNAFADALMGNFGTYSEASDDPIGFFRYTQYHAFVDDTWKLARNFSLELGLRYERHEPTFAQANNWANFDPSLYDPAQAVTITSKGLIDTTMGGNPLNGMICADGGVPSDQQFRIPNYAACAQAVPPVPTGAPRGLYPSHNAWAPRIGFAWAPFGGSSTAIRGGFGIFYNTEEGNMDFDELANPPYARTVEVQNGNLSSPSGGASPAAAPISMSAIDPNMKLPYEMDYSLTVEHEFGRGVFASLGYVGNEGRHLVNKPDINQLPLAQLLAYAATLSKTRPNINSLRPYAGYTTINMFLSRGISNYNSLQAYVSKRKGNSTFTASYTFSKVLTNAGSGSVRDGSAGSNIEFFYMPSLSYGPADFDRTHIFVATYSFRTPSLRSRSAFLRQTLGGWELSGITRAQSGAPFTVIGSFHGSALGTRRADQVGLSSVSNPGPDGWFNGAAFAPAPDTRLGNLGYNTLRGPALYTWDFSFRKNFGLWHEGWNLRFEGDLFNAFNRPNFHNPNSNISSGSYTTIDAAGPPREFQLGLKFSF